MDHEPPRSFERDPAADHESETDAYVEPPPPPPQPLRGRGASSNRSGRYERRGYEAFDDGWSADVAEVSERGVAPGRTRVRPLASRTAMARNDSPDIPFDRSLNPYRGCEHGCVYCFARPDHAYLGHSPGLDFEQLIFAKHDIVASLRAEWAKPGYRPETMAIGASTDPYQPVEGDLRLTRGVLELALACRHPVAIVTKSARVTRDIDLLQQLAALDLVRVFVSLTSLDASLQRTLEPRASAPQARLRAIEALDRAGIPVGVLASPMIPAINDDELEAILEAARAAGARSAGWILLRLPREVGPLFEDWLTAWKPERKERVLALMRSMRGGELYDATFGKRMRGEGPYAALLARRFELAHKRLGFLDSFPPPRTDLFVAPERARRAAVEAAPSRQLRLL